jgi:hypothetical protein
MTGSSGQKATQPGASGAGQGTAPTVAGGPGQKATQVGLILLMALGSVTLWLLSPLFWIWLGSQMQKSSQPSMGPYLLVLVGIGLTTVVIAKLLGSADRAYGRVMTGGLTGRRRLPWNRSLRGERDVDAGQPPTVLTTVMVISVGLAGLLFIVWFFTLAGSSLPGQ